MNIKFVSTFPVKTEAAISRSRYKRSKIKVHFKYSIVLVLLLLAKLTLGQVHSLSYYIEQAKVSSPLIRGLQNQVLSNQIDSQILRAGYRPQVNFQANNSYAPVIGGYGYDNAISNGANITNLVQARKDFISKGYMGSLQKGINLQSQSLRDTIKLTEKDLTRTITDQYILAYSDLLSMDYSQEILQLLQHEDDALKRLTRENVYKQTDYLSFAVTLQQQELSYLQTQILYNSDFLVLNYLAGITDTTIARLEDPKLKETGFPDLFNTVFYTRYTTDSLRIANEHRLIDYSYKPKFGVFGDAGYNSSLQYLPYKNFGFSAGFGLTVPIYDGGQKLMKHNKLVLEEQTRIANRDFFLSQYKIQLLQLFQQLHATNNLLGKINRQIEFSNTLINADLKMLETGDVKMTDLILAINNYDNARNLLLQNNISRLRIINQINYFNP